MNRHTGPATGPRCRLRVRFPNGRFVERVTKQPLTWACIAQDPAGEWHAIHWNIARRGSERAARNYKSGNAYADTYWRNARPAPVDVVHEFHDGPALEIASAAPCPNPALHGARADLLARAAREGDAVEVLRLLHEVVVAQANLIDGYAKSGRRLPRGGHTMKGRVVRAMEALYAEVDRALGVMVFRSEDDDESLEG